MKNTSIKKRSFSRLIHSPFMWFVFIYLAVITLFVIYLMAWGLFASLKTIDDFMENMVWIPKGAPWEWAWSNYSFAFRNFSIKLVTSSRIRSVYVEEMFLNSVIFSLIGATLSAFVPCWMAYLTQRFPYKFSKIIYSTVLVVMIIPIVGSNSAMIKLFHDLNIYGTYLSFGVMKFSFIGMYYLVFFASFQSLPKDFEESAKIDGAGNLTIFLRIMLPMVFPTFLTVFLLNFSGYWNDYMTPLIFLPKKYTISLGVYMLSITTENAFNRTPMKMATAFMSVLPMLIFFLIFRDKMLTSMSLGGIKE